MTDRSSREPVWLWMAVALVAALGWLLRAWPALSLGSWWRDGMGYDDAVYYAASALLWRGELPYRDFVQAHPPGLLVLLAPLSSLASTLGPAEALPLARWLATLAGVASILVSARLALRVGGPVAAITAALAYAVWPEAVGHERSTFLEPFLNLACLLGASVLLSRGPAREWKVQLVAGLFLGLACAIKLLGVIWLAACVLTPAAAVIAKSEEPASFSRRLGGWARSSAWLVLGAAIALLAVAGPFVLVAPGAFLEQTILFQFGRPPDGIGDHLLRVRRMIAPSWPFFTLAAIGLASALRASSPLLRRHGRVLGTAWLATMAAFLLSPSYWPWYNAFLAPAEAPLVGLGAAALWGIASRSLAARVAVVLVLVASTQVPLARALRSARSSDGDFLERIGERVRSIPLDACYIALEPAWALAGDRLPSVRQNEETLVDVYATMLIAAPESDRGRTRAKNALHSAASQERLRDLIEGCEYLSLGDRVRQLTPNTARWIAERWERVPDAGASDADLWRLRR